MVTDFNSNCMMIKFSVFLFFTIIIISACKKNKEDVPVGNRIISLAPNITEIIYAIDADEELVAVTDYCRYPEEAKKKVKIGGLLNPNIEMILRLKPTILFGVPAHAKLNQELQKFGLSITMIPNETISDVVSSIEKIGAETGHETEAKHLITSIRDSLSILKSLSSKSVSKVNTPFSRDSTSPSIKLPSSNVSESTCEKI